MLRSMTAYGRGCASAPFGRIDVELQSVNRKFLEVQLHLPPELRLFETDVRKWLGKVLFSGQIRATVMAQFEESFPLAVTPNLVLARQVKQAYLQLAQALDLPEASIDLALITKEAQVLQYQVEEGRLPPFREALREAVEKALQHLLLMKEEEGRALHEDLAQRLEEVQQFFRKVEKTVEELPAIYRERLTKRLEGFLPNNGEQEERLLRELVLFAERMDVSEEIARFRSHLKQFSSLLKGEEGGVGKKMEFLLQEMHREIHTLSVKAAGVESVQLILNVKNALTKMREQVQNVE